MTTENGTLIIQLFPRTEENAYEENVENGTMGE